MKLLNVMAAAVLSASLLGSCASVAHIEKDDTVNFSGYRSFAWTEIKPDAKDSAKAPVSDLSEKAIRQAVQAELEKAGWKESKKPDVLLTYDVSVERNVREVNDAVYSRPGLRYYFNPYSRRWMSFYYPSQFLGYDTRQQPVREGTVTISMIDAKTDKTIWQGWTTNEVNSKNLTSKEIQSSVKSIFRKFDLVKN